MYGIRYQDVLKLVEEDPDLKEPVASHSKFIKAQIVYAIETEMAQTEDDILSRRLGLIYEDIDTKPCKDAVNEFLIKAHS